MTDQASLEDALDGVDTVYHCAALVSFHPADAAAMTRINADGTAHLVNAMLHRNTPRLVHVSSVAALGRKAGEPTTEDTLFEEQPGTTAYARSKHRAEMEAWRGAAEGLEGGLVVVNPTVVLGPGDFSRSSGALFRHIDKGLKWHPTGSNGFVASEDVAEVCVRLGMSDVRDRRFVLCGDQWPYQKVMDHIADALGKPRPSRPVHPLDARPDLEGFRGGGMDHGQARRGDPREHRQHRGQPHLRRQSGGGGHGHGGPGVELHPAGASHPGDGRRVPRSVGQLIAGFGAGLVRTWRAELGRLA